MHRAKSRMKARNDMIDFLIREGEGGTYINNKWVPVYDLSDPQLLQLYDLVKDEHDSRISKQSEKRGISNSGIGRGRLLQNQQGHTKLSFSGA